MARTPARRINVATAVHSSVRPYTGRDLRKLRREVGVSVWKFAEIMDVSRTQLYRLEQIEDTLPFSTCCVMQVIRSHLGDGKTRALILVPGDGEEIDRLQ